MKRMVILFLAAFVFFLSSFDKAQAVTLDKPHDFTCATCHTPHKTLDNTGYNNICLNCHRGGDPMAGAKSFAPGDAADPFSQYTSGVSGGYQISHRWDGSDVNVRAGAAPPTQPQMTSVRGRTANKMACVRCHNPHSQANKPFLRSANDNDQMCLDCHSSRNTTDQTKGTHPVGVDYQQKAAANPSAFNLAPVNANPANPTSALKLIGGKVSCSSCHGVHTTDSNSSTFDAFSSLSDLKPSDGTLLRTDRRAAAADGINICTNCHTGKVAHNGRGQNIQCSDCHGAHVDTGDGSIPNVWLVKRDMGQGNGQVLFNSTTVKNYKSDDNSGVCQSCHAVPTGSGFQFHLSETNATCNNCHAHGYSKGSFSVDPSKACNACHGYPPLVNSAGAGGYAAGYNTSLSATDESTSGHGSHASTPYQKACVNCHNGNNHQDGIYQDVFNVPAGTVAATGGLTPAYAKAGQTCSAVYCHSNANPRGGTNITKTTPSWKGGKGTIIGTAGECGTCHSAAGGASPTWSVSHTKHINGYAANLNFTCNVCHARTASGNSAIFGNMTARSLHTNGVKDVAFNSFANGGSWDQNSATCSNLYCHSNVQGPVGVGAPTTFTPAWNDAAMTCGSCHASMTKMSNISTATGSHKTHVQGYGFDCSACHGTGYSAAGSTVAIATHVDGVINMGFTGTAATNTATPSYYQGNNKPGDGYKNCSNVYCHSSVQGSGGVGSPGTFAAPVWGAAAVTCGSCHANMATSTAATGSHIKHAQGPAGYSCPTCHNGAGKDPNPPFAATSKHANGTIEISFSGSAGSAVYSKGGSVTPGTGYGSCSNASCHADPYSAATVTTPVWGATGSASGCAACHNGLGAFGGIWNGPDTGGHKKHMTATVTVACGDCHAGAIAGSNGGTAHGDGNIDVTNGYPANVAKHAIGTYTGTCLTTCHSPSTAAVPTPAWGTASTCSSCHDSVPSTGSHNTHIGGLSVSALCGQCHTSAVKDVSGGASHLNGKIEVSNSYTASPVAKHTAVSFTGTCSTAAGCHLNPYSSTLPIITPVWGSDAGNHCAACHNGSGAFDATLGSPATGSHANHMALSGALCSNCHTGASKGSDGGSSHKNGTVEVSNSYTASPVTKHAANTGYTGTCSTTTCHGAGKVTPVWGTVSANSSCTKCHGTGTVTVTPSNYEVVAPSGTSSDTGQVSTGKIGAHQTHLKYFNGLSQQGADSQARCQICHTIPGSVNHATGNATLTFTGLALGNGGSYATSYSAGTCSVYCHNPAAATGGTLATTNAPAATTVSWTDAAYIDTTSGLKTDANCNKCHKSPNGSNVISTIQNHSGYTIATACTPCHEHEGGTGGSVGRQHMDGTKYGSGSCDSCHGYPPLPPAEFSALTGGAYANAKAEDYVGGGGHHSAHLLSTVVATDGFSPCLPCHPSSYHNQGNGTVAQSNVNVDDAADSGYRFDGSRAKRYNRTASTCSNISCHFQPTAAW